MKRVERATDWDAINHRLELERKARRLRYDSIHGRAYDRREKRQMLELHSYFVAFGMVYSRKESMNKEEKLDNKRKRFK